jgi:O-antigen/teichoic acid export membrane protein
MAYACAETIIGVGHYLLASQTIRTFRRDFHIVRPGTLGILADDRQELWRFCKLTWISSSCLMAYGRADEFIAGAAIGASASGLYKIAKNMIRIVISMSDALLETAYSQIARLWGAGASAELRRVVVTMTLTGGVFVGLSTAALLGLGRPVVMSMYGSAYAGTFSILQVLTLDLIYVPFLWFFPLMRASDRLGVSIKLELLAVATSLAVLSVASLNGSIIGIAFGRVAFDLVLVATTGFYITRNRQQLLAAI